MTTVGINMFKFLVTTVVQSLAAVYIQYTNFEVEDLSIWCANIFVYPHNKQPVRDPHQHSRKPTLRASRPVHAYPASRGAAHQLHASEETYNSRDYFMKLYLVTNEHCLTTPYEVRVLHKSTSGLNRLL